MAAQDAELKLSVSLDLTSLRRQLNTIGTSLDGQPLYLPFKFNRQLIADEYRLLGKYISSKTFDVKIESQTLEKLSIKVNNFQERLKELQDVKIDMAVGAVQSLSQKDAGKIKSGLRSTILGGSKKILIPTTIIPSITQKDVRAFKSAVKEKLSGISVKVKADAMGGFAGSSQGVAGLMEFMQSQGMIGKTASDMEMRMKKGGDDLSRDLDDAVKSAEKIKATFDGIAKSIATTGKTTATVQGKRLGLGNVPLMSGSIERRIERAASSIAGTLSSDVLKLLYPEINKAISSFTALRGQVQQNASKLSGFSLIIGLAAFAGVPLAKSVVKLTGSANDFAKLLDGLGPKLKSAFLKAASNILNASSTRLLTGGRLAGLLSPAAGPAGLLPPAYRGIGPSRNAGALPPAYRGIGPAAEPVGFLPRYTSRGARDEAMRQIGAGEEGAGKLALTDEMVRRRSPIQAARVREIFDPREFEFGTLRLFRVIGDALEQAAEQAQQAADQAKKARIDRSVDELMRSIDDAIKVAQARVRVGRVQVADLGSRAQGALSAGRVAGFLPGRPSQASVLELNNILARAIREYFAAVARGIKPNTGVQGRPLLGPGSAVAGLLPAAGGTTPRGQMRFNAVSTGAVLGQPQILKAPNIPSPIGGAGAGGGVPPRPPSGGGGGGMGGFGRALGGINLPGTGVVREIGNEFAMATKQVLLFGTAYKALAFATSFPAQVGQAVGALQSFNNTLKAISPSAEEAKTSNQFILDIVDRYNVPLQSARDGFTKLYASMAPAGFKGEEIRALFMGVSQAAATFGMSADKVDRVNYAFAQMASKGQVMSEELKGQLGDVLPGAMGIFAEAAGFKGPKAIEQFSKALEDGAYKGDAMRVLLKNVTGVLQKEFGPGAEGAARTFQGVINRMQNSTKLLYEAFEPVAVGFLNGVVVPLTSGLKTITDGVNAFLKGTQAKTAGGFALAQELERLKPAFDGIRTNIANLLPVFQTFGQITLSVARALLQLEGNPVVGYLARLYAIALPLNMLLGVMRGLWAANALQLVIFNARIATGTTTLTAFRGMMAATGATAATTAASIRAAGLTMRAFFATTGGVGLVVAGISILIERFMSMNQALENTRNKALGAAQAIRFMSQTEARSEQYKRERVVRDLKKLQQSKYTEQFGNETNVPVPKDVAKRLEESGIPLQRDLAGIAYLPKTSIPGYLQREEGLISESKYRQRQVQFDESQALAPLSMAPIPMAPAADKKKNEAINNASELNQLVQKELELQNQLGLIGKDELSQIEAKAKLAKEILTLTLQNIRLTETGAIQTQSIKNATLAYQVTVGELNQEWENAIEKIKEIDQEGKDLYKTINEQSVTQDSPLKKALVDIREEAEDGIKKIDELLKSLSKQAGLRPEGLAARTFLGGIRSALQGRTPEQENLTASEKVTKTIKEDLKSQLQELGNAGRSLTTLDGIIIKIGEDWSNLAPSVKADLADLATQIDAAKPFAEMAKAVKDARENFEQLYSPVSQLTSISSAVSESIGSAFKGLITGATTAQEALAGVFQSIADSFADMVAEMITSWLRAQLLKGFMSLFPGGGTLGSASSNLDKYAPLGMANGGVFTGGFRAFANGGVVTGPTLGLVGEGRYNEAVIPLPDGKSVPVELGGAMGNQITSNIVVNVSSDGKTSSSGAGSDSAGLGRKLEGAVKQVIVDELRPGGLLSGRR